MWDLELESLGRDSHSTSSIGQSLHVCLSVCLSLSLSLSCNLSLRGNSRIGFHRLLGVSPDSITNL